jgi:hypothetical protein
VDFRSLVALKLDIPRALDECRNCCGALGFAPVGQFALFHGRYLDVNVDTVGHRPQC